MAVELERFIERQLDCLPSGNPDRVYLKGLLEATKGYNARADKGPTLEFFLEGKETKTIKIGGKTTGRLEEELKNAGINVSLYAGDMLHSKDFTTLEDPQELDIVIVKVQDLGLFKNPTTNQVYARAQRLGLELCPSEVGPHLRLAYKDQPKSEVLFVGMKLITGCCGDPCVFWLECGEGGLWLHGGWADPDGRWGPGHQFVFTLRK